MKSTRCKLALIILAGFLYAKNSSAQLDTAYIMVAGGIYDDECRQVIVLRNGGYVAVGSTASFGQGTTDVYIIKTDNNNICQWSETIGEAGIDRGYSVAETFDGGLVIAGYTNDYGALGYDVLLVKTDSMGTLQWVKTFGGSDWDFGYSVRQTADSGFVVCGESYSYSNGDADVLVLKTDEDGNLIWLKNVGGLLAESGYSVAVSRSGNIVAAGKTFSFGSGDSDAYLVALNSSGDTLWTKTYGDLSNEAAYGIDTTSDNGFVFAGVTDSLGLGDRDGYFVKVDSMGNKLWQQFIGGLGDGTSQSVAQRSNGEYIVAGTDNSYGAGGYGFYMTRTNSGGNWQAGPTFGGPGDEEGFSVAISPSGGAIFGGTTTSYGHGVKDVYLIKLNSDSIVQDYVLDIRICNDTPVVAGIVQYPSNTLQTIAYPNPFHEWTNIVFNAPSSGKHQYDFEVYNLIGRHEVSILNITSNKFRFHRGNLKNGLYYFFISIDGARQAGGKLLID